MSTEERFTAAVNVIKNLPKNGSYKPSNEMLLKFYSYYKQVNEGPCTLPKPPFWDPVRKAKWDAWKTLGDMTAETAMLNYVSELKKIIETMSFSEPVAEFMDVLGPFYEIVEVLPCLQSEKLEMTNGHNCIEQIVTSSDESDSEEYLDSHNEFDSSQSFNDTSSNEIDGSTELLSISNVSMANGTVAVSKSKEVHFQEQNEHLTIFQNNVHSKEISDMSLDVEAKRSHISNEKDDNHQHDTSNNSNVQAQVAFNVRKLQQSIHDVENRVKNLETQFKQLNTPNAESKSWWPFPQNWPVRTTVFIVLWPLVTQFAWFIVKVKLKQVKIK